MPMSFPPTDPARPAEPPAELPFVWRCYVCRKWVAFGFDEMTRFLNHGWPVCCGQVALIFRRDLDPGREPTGGAERGRCP